LKHKVKNQ